MRRISTLLAYHHQNFTNACFMVAEAVKAFEALAPVANPMKRLTRSTTGSRIWWRSAKIVRISHSDSTSSKLHWLGALPIESLTKVRNYGRA